MKTIALIIFLLASGCVKAAPNYDLRDQLNEQLDSIFQNNKKHIPDSIKKFRTHPNLMIFVSLSMPESTLRSTIRQAYKLNAAVLIRGVLKEGMKPTIGKISNIIIDDTQGNKKPLGGISFAPEKFKQFNISKVPTFILLKSDECQKSNKPCDNKLYDKLTGTITPVSALTMFKNKGDYQLLAKKMLASLED